MHAFWTLQTDSEASEEVGRQPPFTGLPRIAPAFIGLSRWLLNDPPKWWTRLRLGLDGIQEVTGSIPVSSTGFFRFWQPVGAWLPAGCQQPALVDGRLPFYA